MANDDNMFYPDYKPLSEYEKEDLLRVIVRTSERMKAFELKSFQLVKYGRWDGGEGPWADKGRAVKEKYPEETQALDGDDGVWEHGFNSGCLATVRLFMDYVNILELLDGELQYTAQLERDGFYEEGEERCPPCTEEDVLAEAEEEFPDLDT